MKKETEVVAALVVIFLLSSSLSIAQVRLKGDITGIVSDDEGEILPGSTLLLTGEKLFQKSLSTVSSEKGLFRFVNLNPGIYEIEISLPGFNTLKIQNISVSVGKTSSVNAQLTMASVTEEVTVIAQADLIDKKTAQISTNYSTLMVEKIPTSRNMLDLMDSTAGINDGGAYGAGGKEGGSNSPWNSRYSQGTGVNTYRLNGVDVSSVRFGDNPVNSNYDIIDEIEIVGIGASAEYGNFLGTTVNVITKSGTNTLHGGLGFYYSDSHFYGDNSGEILDLKPADIKRDGELSFSLSGPIIKEKLFFFLAVGYTNREIKEYESAGYGVWKQPHYYLKLDWVINKSNSMSFMANQDPMNNENLGLMTGSGPEVAYSDQFKTTTFFANWQSIFSENTFFELKFAGFNGHSQVVPVSGDVPSITNSLTGVQYNSSGWNRDNTGTRYEVDSVLSHYVESFLGGSHNLKMGLEYENAKDLTSENLSGGGMISMQPLAGPLWMYFTLTGASNNSETYINRFSGFVQDDIVIGTHLSLNLGLRYDSPRLSAEGISGTIAKFSTLAPRIGISYDFDGDAGLVAHASFGRYYDRMRTNAFVTSIPGLESIAYYLGIMPGPLTTVTPEQFEALKQTKLFEIDLSTIYSVDPDINTPYTDVFSLGFEKRLFNIFALSVDYVYKTDRDMLYIGDKTDHSFVPVQWTDDYVNFGKTHTLYQLDDNLPNDWSVSNSKWAKRRHHMLIVSLQKRDSSRWSFMTSFTYQNSKGNVDNMSGDYNSTLFALDQDPNYINNDDRWGYLSFARPFQFKLITGYVLPLGISITGDLRWLAGRYWNANGYWGEPPVTGLWPSGVFPLEKRGSRQTPSDKYLNLRLAKSFNLGSSKNLDIFIDVFNVFNNSVFLSDMMETVHTQPNATWKITPGSKGDAFGQPFKLEAPLHARFGLRFSF